MASSVSGSATLFNSIIVTELPPLRPLHLYPPAPPTKSRGGAPPPYIPDAAKPKFILVLPHGDPARLPRDVLPFCFPDLDHLLRTPYAYEHTADEYVFTLTQKEDPQRLHGFCRRYRIGSASVGHRLDLASPAPDAQGGARDAASAPTYQCICILSERCGASSRALGRGECARMLRRRRRGRGGGAGGWR
jgi:hypothetical protein